MGCVGVFFGVFLYGWRALIHTPEAACNSGVWGMALCVSWRYTRKYFPKDFSKDFFWGGGFFSSRGCARNPRHPQRSCILRFSGAIFLFFASLIIYSVGLGHWAKYCSLLHRSVSKGADHLVALLTKEGGMLSKWIFWLGVA